MRPGQVLDSGRLSCQKSRCPSSVCSFLSVCLGPLRPRKEPIHLSILCLASILTMGTDVTLHGEQTCLHKGFAILSSEYGTLSPISVPRAAALEPWKYSLYRVSLSAGYCSQGTLEALKVQSDLTFCGQQTPATLL